MGRWDEICKALEGFSQETHEWMSDQPNINEDSVTDWLLRFLSKQLPFVHYYRFNRSEEATTGADWDWWIVNGVHAFGARVQAKRLRAEADHYSSLAHSNRNGLQIDLLRNSAKAEGLPALYAFFNADNSGSQIICAQGGRPSLHVAKGLLLTSASRLHARMFSGERPRLGSEELVSISNALSCVACCPLSRDSADSLQGVVSHFKHYFPEEFQPDDIGVRAAGPPSYVLSLMRGHQREMGEEWERGAELPSSTKAVLIFDLNED